MKIKNKMKDTCFGSISYCCGLEKKCDARDKAIKKLGLKKSSNKALETFNSHCVDSFSIASELSEAEPIFNIKVVDDTYRPTRRRLHDTQPKRGNIREKYSTGSFKGIRKGTICEFGQIAGGTKKTYFIRNSDNKRIGKTKISWLSHNFKLKNEEVFLLPTLKGLGIRKTQFI